MIQERGDYKSLDPTDILERLNIHEFQQAEKSDLYGPSYGRSRALKAKAVSSSEGEDSDSSLGDPEELSRELAMLVRKFQKVLKAWSLCDIVKRWWRYIRFLIPWLQEEDLPQMQETWSLHNWLSSMGKGIKEEEVLGW